MSPVVSISTAISSPGIEYQGKPLYTLGTFLLLHLLFVRASCGPPADKVGLPGRTGPTDCPELGLIDTAREGDSDRAD